MSMDQSIGTASANVVDRVMAALLSGLELEFGRGAGEELAHRFLAAEEADFCWDARVEERWIGAYERPDDEEFELDRVAIFWTTGRQMVLRHRAREWRWPGPWDDWMPSVQLVDRRAGCNAQCALITARSAGRGGVGRRSSLFPFFEPK